MDNISSVNKKNNGLISKQSNKKTVSKRKRQRRSRSYRPKEATYLTVNGSQSPTIYANSSYDKLIVGVETDGADWNIRCVGNWYKVYKKSSREIEIDVENNFSHDKRNDWFLISSGNKQVNVNISQLGKPINAYAEIYNINFTLNNDDGSGRKFLKVEADINISGAAEQKIDIFARIKFTNGTYVRAAGKSVFDYKDSSLFFSHSMVEVVPNTDNTTSYHVTMYIPNESLVMVIKKKRDLQIELQAFCVGTNNYISDNTYSKTFKARLRKHKIETSYD